MAKIEHTISKSTEAYYKAEVKKIKETKENEIIKALNNYVYAKPAIKNIPNITQVTINNQIEYLYSLKKTDTAILYLHGGGYILPLFKNNIKEAILASTHINNYDTLIIDYRVKGNGEFKDSLDDAFYSYQYLLDNYNNVIILGESAGGGLAVGLVERIIDEGIKKPNKLILISPWLDYMCSGSSYTFNRLNDIFFGSTTFEVIPNPFPQEKNKYYTTLQNEFTDFPEAIIFVGSSEIVLSDSVALAEKLNDKNSTLHIYKYMWHDFLTGNDSIPEASDAWSLINEFINK